MSLRVDEHERRAADVMGQANEVRDLRQGVLVVTHNLVRESCLAEGAPGRGGALRIISFLCGLFVVGVQYNRVEGIVGRLRAR
jgi:hypothetical protein